MSKQNDPLNDDDGRARRGSQGKFAETLREVRWLLSLGGRGGERLKRAVARNSSNYTRGPFAETIYKVLQTARGLLSALSVLIILLLLIFWNHSFLPGALRPLYIVALGFLIISALMNAPPLFRKLPRWTKPGSWLFLFLGMITSVVAVANIQAAYSRTPAGEEAARLNAIEADREDEASAEAARLAGEEADRVAAGLPPSNPQQAQAVSSPATQARADRCLSRARGPLADTVRASLQNPRSFEFVDITLATVTGDQAVVYMTYRGENGFGAIVTEAVRAVMDTGDCSITEIGETQSE